jgi:predicted O-methyltransferase YrrM
MDRTTVDDIVARPPEPHDDSGHLVSWRLEDSALQYLDSLARPGLRTLEVGVGASTMVLAAQRCQHLAITASASEVRRLRAYASQRAIALDTVEFRVGRSQDVLPTLDHHGVDLAVVDGEHAFPLPIVDWLFAAERLRVGGIMLIDDVQIWTGSVLRAFLGDEPGWSLEWEESRAFAFRKTAEPVVRPWPEQPYVASRSKVWGASGWEPAPT